MKKIILILLLLFCGSIITEVKAQQEIYWIDTTGGVNKLRKVSNKYPFPVEVFGTIDTLWNLQKVDSLIYVQRMDSLMYAQRIDSLMYVRKLDSIIHVQRIDSLMYVRRLDSIIHVQRIDSLMYVRRLDSIIHVQRIDTLFELVNGHVFNSDTTQLKYRNSYTLTYGDSLAIDTLYGNFNKIYIGYSDTGGTFTDSITVELWDALLSVWKQVGVTNLWNGNFYSYISPGAGETAEYVLDHDVIDIIRFRYVNNWIPGRTGSISWTGKGDK